MRDHTIVSWNVAGLLGLLRKAPDSVRELVEGSSAEVVCLQETKLTDAKIERTLQALSMPEWHVRWSNSHERNGQCGVMILSREKPMGEDHGFSPASGRFLAVEFESYILVNVYVLNSGRNLVNVVRRLTEWDPAFRDHVLSLRASGKPVIVAGDMNVAPEPIDVYDPVRLRKTAGFTAGERAATLTCWSGQNWSTAGGRRNLGHRSFRSSATRVACVARATGGDWITSWSHPS